MSTGFQPLHEQDMTQTLQELLLPQLQQLLASRAPGHCMRVTDLDVELMVALARAVRRALPEAHVFVLGEPRGPNDKTLCISSTKLVELRNPLPDGTLRPPLLVFLPSNVHTSAEDSFGVATFEEIPVADAYKQLVDMLLQRIPLPLQGHVRAILTYLTAERWAWADLMAQVRYLLVAITNGVDGESLGAALYEVGLIPDFRLFDDPAMTYGRIRKNVESMHKLIDSDRSIRGRVLELGLRDKTVQRRLAHFLAEVGAEEPHMWASQIVLERANWDLSFDKWRFAEDISPERITIKDVHTDLPMIADDETDPRLQAFVGQQVLNPRVMRRFKVDFTVDPHPGKVQGLHHFSVQICAHEGGPIGVTKYAKVWKSKKTSCTVTLDRLDKVEFEEGWYVVRILPWTANGDQLPLAVSSDTGSQPHESEPFYVLSDVELPEEPPERTLPQAVSLEHARFQLQCTALLNRHEPSTLHPTIIGWTDKNAAARAGAYACLLVKFGREGAYQIPVARPLKTLEQSILSSPEQPVSWRMHIHIGEVASPTGDILEWPKATAVESFFAARVRYFEAVRAEQHELISQAADFLALHEVCSEYAAAYRDLLLDLRRKVERNAGRDQQRAIIALRTALAIDTVRVIITDFRGQTREAALVGPTHPLRALWIATWSQVAQHWLAAGQDGSEEYIGPLRDSILRRLVPLHVPATVTLSDSRVLTALATLHPFWTLYAPVTEPDARGLLDEISAALSLPVPIQGSTVLTGEMLASSLARYLVQHPYVRTLTMNAFNPGRAALIADALVSLQKQEAFADLHYDIRLFVPDPAVPNIGEAIEQLCTSQGVASPDTHDTFSTTSGSHLAPKLSLAVHTTQDFSTRPEHYRAHLSLLFDLFPAEEIGTSPALQSYSMIPVHGLLQDFIVDFRDNEDGTFWRRQLRHGEASPLPAAEAMVDLLADLPRVISGATATIATGQPAFEHCPTITLSLDTAERELMHHVHEVSDWVFTLDRHLGVEFYDHGGTRTRPDYLIDYVPSANTGLGHQLIITSRCLIQFEAIFEPLLAQYGLNSSRERVSMLLEQLRLLSGRLTLKLMSSPTQQTEALGLALARLFLLYQGALSNQLILPLDTHLDLFRSAKRYAEELGETVTLQRTDLALCDLNASSRTICCRLVEVKGYAHVGSLGTYSQLKENIAQQIRHSEDVLRQHFDPHWKTPDRPDRLLKTWEFATLLEFYLHRSRRYGLIEAEAAQEAQFLLTTLERGYMLQFTRSGLIFDFNKPGTEAPEREFGIEFHRIGVDLIEALLAEASLQPRELPTVQDQSIPRLEAAAFIVPQRDRSTTWEHLRPLHRDAAAPQHTYGQEALRPLAAELPLEPDAVNVDSQADKPVRDRLRPVDSLQANTPPPVSAAYQRRDDVVMPPEAGSRADDASLAGPPYDVVLGVQDATPQYGILGEMSGRKIALDLNQTHTISLFGVQGGGKSYTLGSIVEMACLAIPQLNLLPSPLATIIFHYSPTEDYQPEFTSMVQPNTAPDQIALLQERYGVQPCALQDVVLLVPKTKLEERRAEYPHLDVLPIAFASSELKAMHWKFLMGAVGSQSMYLRQVNLIMRKLREQLTLQDLLQGVENSTLSEHLKDLAKTRLQFAVEYIDDNQRLSEVLCPGRLVIVDVRDAFIEKDEALGLFVVLLQIFSEVTYAGRPFNKLVVFDEAHKYIESPDLVAGLIEVIREMRHKGTSILVASQDPPSVPVSLIELSSQIILHRFNSPAWLRHVQRANVALNSLTPERMSHLGPGEAYVWSSKATDDGFTTGALKIRCRPRVTQHGGSTKTAVGEAAQG